MHLVLFSVLVWTIYWARGFSSVNISAPILTFVSLLDEDENGGGGDKAEVSGAGTTVRRRRR